MLIWLMIKHAKIPQDCMRKRPKPYVKTKISPEDAGLISLGPVKKPP